MVIILVILFIFLFLKFFSFEPDKNQPKPGYYPTITDEYVDKYYSYLNGYSENNNLTMYNKNFTKLADLAPEVIFGIAHNYITINDQFKLKYVSIEEKNELNNQNILYKIEENDILKSVKEMFGGEATINLKNYKLSEKRSVYYDEIKKCFYIYNDESIEDSLYVEYRDMDSYMVSNNGNTLVIFEYYLKCKKENGLCYNDEKATINNNKYKLKDDNINITNKDNLQMYQHTFKYENNSYYWYSSEIVR